jgi:hypothetical protein
VIVVARTFGAADEENERKDCDDEERAADGHAAW